MFALEISFKDGVSQPETILVRRPQALIGATDYAHVVIEDMKGLDYQIRLIQQIGRRFCCKAMPLREGAVLPEFLDGEYDSQLSLSLANLQLHVTCLDIDLGMRAGEPPDRAGVRVLRQACSEEGPRFPAVAVIGAVPMVISFVPDQPVYIGRSNQCAVRLDSAEISGKHARLGYEAGEFWIEDLGSTNGTFVNRQQISGRLNLPPLVPIVLGSQVSILGVTSREELNQALNSDAKPIQRPAQHRYPVLLSVSEVARPARLVLPEGGKVTIGRDPASDMWLGAPHISRRHCQITLNGQGVTVEDFSTNGTAYDGGILKKGRVLELVDDPKVLNFGGNLTVAICFNETQEELFKTSAGASDVFMEKSQHEQGDGGTTSEHRRYVTSGASGIPTIQDSFSGIEETHSTSLSQLFLALPWYLRGLVALVTVVLCVIFFLVMKLFWQNLM